MPDLCSGLSFEQMVVFSLVHGLLGFLGCEFGEIKLIPGVLPRYVIII